MVNKMAPCVGIDSGVVGIPLVELVSSSVVTAQSVPGRQRGSEAHQSALTCVLTWPSAVWLVDWMNIGWVSSWPAGIVTCWIWYNCCRAEREEKRDRRIYKATDTWCIAIINSVIIAYKQKCTNEVLYASRNYRCEWERQCKLYICQIRVFCAVIAL